MPGALIGPVPAVGFRWILDVGGVNSGDFFGTKGLAKNGPPGSGPIGSGSAQFGFTGRDPARLVSVMIRQ